MIRFQDGKTYQVLDSEFKTKSNCIMRSGISITEGQKIDFCYQDISRKTSQGPVKLALGLKIYLHKGLSGIVERAGWVENSQLHYIQSNKEFKQ